MNIPNDCTKSFNTLNETCNECVDKKEDCPFQKSLVTYYSDEIPEEWFNYHLDGIYNALKHFRELERRLKMDVKHEIGSLMINTMNNFSRSDSYSKKIVQNTAKTVGIGERDLYYCIAFAGQWKRVDDCPANTWTEAKKLIDGREQKKECRHKHTQMVEVCSDCNKRIST